RVPSAFDLSNVVVGVRSDGTGGSVLRIDAQVVWRPHRTATERVPSSVHAVVIQRSVHPDQGTPTARERVVTDTPTVARLIRLFNGLPTLPSGGMTNGQFHCNTLVEVGFARSSTSSAGLTVSTCDPGTQAVWSVIGQGEDPRIPRAL